MPVFNNILAGASGSAGGAGDYNIERSLRFNNDDSAYLSKSPSSAGNRKTWTFSTWCKQATPGQAGIIFNAQNGTTQGFASNFWILFYAGTIVVGDGSVDYLNTNKLRDPSAWYHIVVACDTTQSSPSDRLKIYINGVESEYTGDARSSISPNSLTAINSTYLHRIGDSGSYHAFFDGYLADTHLIDGQTPGTATDDASGSVTGIPNAEYLTEFGAFDATTGVWNPKAFTGSHGTNGFHLDYSDNSSDSALGNDAAGSNNWTVNNLSATEIAVPSVTVVGDPTSSTDNPFGSGNGYSVDFDGNDQLQFTGPGTVTGDLTVECFYKMDSGSGYDRIFSTKEDSYSSEQTMIRRHDNGNLQFYFGNGTPEQQSSSISANTWRHAAIVYDRSAGTVSYYDHGSRVGTDSYNSDVPITLMVAGGGFGSEYFDGKVSNARITKQVLYTGSSYTVPTSTLTTTSQGATASNVTLLCCHKSSVTEVEGGLSNSAGIDSLLDSPSNYEADSGNNGGNYATLNPLNHIGNGTLSNGNLEVAGGSGAHHGFSTIGVSSGKWYAEITTLSGGSASNIEMGIVDLVQLGTNTTQVFDAFSRGFGYRNDANKITNNGASSYGATYGGGNNKDVIGMAADLDNGTLTFYKNGVSQGTAFTGIPSGYTYHFATFVRTSGDKVAFNFGQRPFAYTPPTGFKSLCTQNLDDPLIADGSNYFDAKLYTGNGNTQSISGYAFSPDFVWYKSRGGAAGGSHFLFDQVRGATEFIRTNSANAEATQSNALTAFTSDGFTVGNHSSTNYNNDPYVAWAWDAPTSFSNSAGANGASIASSGKKNQSAGFSIVTYTGTGSSGTVGHGLNATPELIIVKCRSNGENWRVYTEPTGNTKALFISTGEVPNSSSNYWNSTSPTSSVFSVGTDSGSNNNNYTYVAYCFAPVAGYSMFGSYTGNGSADGPFIYTGFRVRYLLQKRTDSSGSWAIKDAAREPYNVVDTRLYADSSNADMTQSNYHEVDFLSNGFKVRSPGGGEDNANNGTFLYAAFAENPFKYARAR